MPNLLSQFSWHDAPSTAYLDALADDQRWSTWDAVERLCRGPEPWPDWVVTDAAAIDTDLGVPVPYPVQLAGTEILMEFIGDDDAAAPRLHQTRPSLPDLGTLFEQLLAAMQTMARLGLVHGDLSPYNTLASGLDNDDPRLVIIDVPQLVDLASNPNAFDLLHRDCVNMATWFTSAGHVVDADDLLGEVLAYAW